VSGLTEFEYSDDCLIAVALTEFSI